MAVRYDPTMALWGIEVHSSQDIVTLTAALAGIVWVYVNLLRPGAHALRHGVKVLIKTADAVGVLDELPAWMRKREQVEASLEAEVGIAQAELGRVHERLGDRLSKIENKQDAIIRELAIDARRVEPDTDGPSESA